MGLQMGLINELPINQKYAAKITDEHINDPFRLAQAITNQELEDAPSSRLSRAKSRHAAKFPHKPIFGGDLPPSLALVTPVDERKY